MKLLKRYYYYKNRKMKIDIAIYGEYIIMRILRKFNPNI